jgi:hypothetical protein
MPSKPDRPSDAPGDPKVPESTDAPGATARSAPGTPAFSAPGPKADATMTEAQKQPGPVPASVGRGP